MQSLTLLLPFLLPLVGAILSFSNQKRSRPFALLFLIGHLAASCKLAIDVYQEGAVATTAGAWLAPFGIVLIADAFAALLLSFASLVFVTCLIGEEEDRGPFFWPLILLLQAGVSLSFISGDLFNLFVAFELMLMSSYAILATQGNPKLLDSAYSYLSMNVAASFLYLIAVAMFYGHTGQLNFAALAQHLQNPETPTAWGPMLAILLVMLVKGGAFPLYFWLPDSYPLLPSSLGGLFSGTLSKVGVYVLYRLVITVFPFEPLLNSGLMVIACLTMFFGVMGAISRGSIAGILSYHTLSQVGYILLALTFSTPLAIASGIFFTIHNMVVKSSLFLIGGIAGQFAGNGSLQTMGGLWRHVPFLGVLFLLQAFSLAGLPPLSGFWGKYLLFFEGMTIEAHPAVGVALITSFFTLFSMIKIWNSAFIGDATPAEALVPSQRYWGATVLTVLALLMGIMVQHSFALAQHAADQLIDNQNYVQVSLSSGYRG